MKLEVGKIYLTREGKKVKIEPFDSPSYPFLGVRCDSLILKVSYTPDGCEYITATSPRDIVSEFDPLDALFDEPVKEEPQKMQEQQKPLFEVGKTYKDGENRDITIVSNDETYQAYPIVGRDTETHAVYTYTKSGLAWSGDRRSLIPPEPPLRIVVGGFYLDNRGDIRILTYNQYHKKYTAVSVFQIDTGYPSVEESFPEHRTINFELVKLLTYEEAQKLIKEKLS